MCEVERCLKEISSNEDCEREIHVLRLEREMHVEAISAIDNAITEVGIFIIEKITMVVKRLSLSLWVNLCQIM